MTISATRRILIDVPGAQTLNEAVAALYGPDAALSLPTMQESGWEFAEVNDATAGVGSILPPPWKPDATAHECFEVWEKKEIDAVQPR